jgi:hypothetical protein
VETARALAAAVPAALAPWDGAAASLEALAAADSTARSGSVALAAAVPGAALAPRHGAAASPAEALAAASLSSSSPLPLAAPTGASADSRP